MLGWIQAAMQQNTIMSPALWYHFTGQYLELTITELANKNPAMKNKASPLHYADRAL